MSMCFAFTFYYLWPFCVLLGQSPDRCPIFLLLVIETDKFLKPNTHAHFWATEEKRSQPWGKEGKDTWSSENFTSDFVAWISLKHLISQKNELSIARTKVNSTGLPALHMTGLEMGKY